MFIVFAIGVFVGFFLAVFVMMADAWLTKREATQTREAVAAAVLKWPPLGYKRCKNFASCGWWFKQYQGAFDECNHCFTSEGEYEPPHNAGDSLRECEEDPEIGPDWRL